MNRPDVTLPRSIPPTKIVLWKQQREKLHRRRGSIFGVYAAQAWI